MNKKLAGSFSCFALILVSLQISLAGESGSRASIEAVIGAMRSNEVKAASVVIEGGFEADEYDGGGVLVNQKKFQVYRFSRNNLIMKLEKRGEEYFLDKKSSRLENLRKDEVAYHSPDGTSYVDLNQRIVHKRTGKDAPYPFPLLFGLGARYSAETGEVRGFSSSLQNLLGEGLLKWRQDPDQPSLLHLEAMREQIRFCWTVDCDRGFLIVDMRADQILNSSSELPFEQISVSPRNFEGNWFIEKASRIVYLYLRAGEPTLARREELITVTSYRTGVTFNKGELELGSSQ